MRRGILLGQLISEQVPPVAPPAAAPAAAPQAPAAPPADPGQSADALVQKDFNAFKAELKGIEDQKSSIISKWEQAIKKKVAGHKVKVLASKAQHFQPASEYTIDVSDVKIGYHYDKTTGELVYDLILMDGDKKYFMKPSGQQGGVASAPEAPAQEPAGEPETTQSPEVPDSPPEVPPAEEPAAEPDAGGEPTPDAGPEAPGGEAPAEPAPEAPAPEAPPAPEEPAAEVPPGTPKKKKPVPPAVGENLGTGMDKADVVESSVLNDESYSVDEILRDIRSVVEEVTGRSNMKPYIIGAGTKKGGKIRFEIEIPKSHLRENMTEEDIALGFDINDMVARVSEAYKGTKYNVVVEKHE